DVQVRAEHRQAMYAQLGDLPAGRYRTTQTSLLLVHDSSLPALFLLGLFDDDTLANVANTFAFVGLGRTVRANFRGHLTNSLLVCAFQDHFGLRGAFNLNAFGHFVHDVVRETQLKLDGVALNLSAVTHADQAQAALKARAHANNHVVDQRTHRAGHRACFTRVIGSFERQLVVFQFDIDRTVQRLRQRAQRTFDPDLVLGEGRFDAFRQFDRVFCNTRHVYSLRHVAKDFAAHAFSASLAIGHHATRGGDDGHAQAVHDLRNGMAAFVDTQARLRN